MKHLSLTARMSLMFMSAVIAVLTVAGLSFNMLSQHHFKMLDRQALVEKLESAKHILNNARGEASLSEELPQLRALLGAHQDLAATILAVPTTNPLAPAAAGPYVPVLPKRNPFRTVHSQRWFRTERT